MGRIKTVETPTLEIAYAEHGPADALPVVLLHGYPYDIHAFDEVVPILTQAGLRTIVPYLRGYGPTRFLSPDTLRSGQQAAMGQDLLDLLDALAIPKAVLAGFDWGGRSACIVAALWPERAHGLVSCAGYTVQDLTKAAVPASPEQEARYWYQYYFHTERGRNGLTKHRAEIARLLWSMWSPTWSCDAATFARTAASFDNPDFVEVVLHSYRHRTGSVAGDPAYDEIEQRLTLLPTVSVPSIVLHGADDNVTPLALSENQERFFTSRYQRRVLPGVGHNPPQEAPRAFADAVLEVAKR